MIKLNDHTDRKFRICNRVQAFAQRNHDPRRPIVNVLEVKIGDYVPTTAQALKDRDETIYRPLLAFSLFQND